MTKTINEPQRDEQIGELLTASIEKKMRASKELRLNAKTVATLCQASQLPTIRHNLAKLATITCTSEDVPENSRFKLPCQNAAFFPSILPLSSLRPSLVGVFKEMHFCLLARLADCISFIISIRAESRELKKSRELTDATKFFAVQKQSH